MINKDFISITDTFKQLGINTRQERRSFFKLVKEGKFTVHAKHPQSGEILPYKITDLNLETGEVQGYFLN